MKMMRWIQTFTALLMPALIVASAASHAESEAVAMPGDNHLVVFRYDPNNTFTIYSIPGAPTDIQLGSDEKITGFALGDTVQWLIEELPGHLFVKPLKPDLFTAGTLVTDRRVYQLAFRSLAPHGRWYQKVSWNYPESGFIRNAGAQGSTASSATTSEIPPVDQLDPAHLNFAYDVLGEADFRPEAVFDDGRFTWLRVRSPQALPALFMVDGEGVRLVNYVIKGEYFVVQRLMPEVLLKLGKTEVRVVHRRAAKKSAGHAFDDIFRGER
jgi:P-type conjugative transfer protein TrbG